jgi:aryl-alcohol dehydrogenase-like predicted oxidoreductase
MDYVDLIFCHRPDPQTPIEETVRAMHDIVTSGRALYWGVSEWSADQIMQAWQVAERHHLHTPRMEQPQYNLIHRHRVEHEYARLYAELGLGLTTWSPLASGLLSGKYNDGLPAGSRLTLPSLAWLKDEALTPEKLAVARAVSALARELGCTASQLSIAWCLKNPNVSSVITGATRAEQVRENLAALEVVPRLTPEVMERIDMLLRSHPVSISG